MKHRAVILVTVLAVATLASGAALWASAEGAGDDDALTGRDISSAGALQTLRGTLRCLDDEWHLESGDVLYALHLGWLGHETDLPFREGAPTEVRGFVVRIHVAPVAASSEGKETRFWNEDRSPRWAGQGNRRGAVNGR